MSRLFEGGLGIIYHYDLQVTILFLDNPELLLLERDESLCEKYDVHIRSIRRWKHDYQHSRFACSVDMDNADNDELAKKYGVRTATINLWKKDADTQWQFGMSILNN